MLPTHTPTDRQTDAHTHIFAGIIYDSFRITTNDQKCNFLQFSNWSRQCLEYPLRNQINKTKKNKNWYTCFPCEQPPHGRSRKFGITSPTPPPHVDFNETNNSHPAVLFFSIFQIFLLIKIISFFLLFIFILVSGIKGRQKKWQNRLNFVNVNSLEKKGGERGKDMKVHTKYFDVWINCDM